MGFKGPMVDMEMDDEDQYDSVPMPVSLGSNVKAKPQYPYGLRIRLNEKDMEKLGLSVPEKYSTIDLRAMGMVTAVTTDDNERGCFCTVEIQLQKLKVENEDTEED